MIEEFNGENINNKKELIQNFWELMLDWYPFLKIEKLNSFALYRNIAKEQKEVWSLKDKFEESSQAKDAEKLTALTLYKYIKEIPKTSLSISTLYTDYKKGIDMSFCFDTGRKKFGDTESYNIKELDLSSLAIIGTDITINQNNYKIEEKIESIKKIFDENRFAKIDFLKFNFQKINNTKEGVLLKSKSVIKDIFIFPSAKIEELKENFLAQEDNDFLSGKKYFLESSILEKEIFILFFEQKRLQYKKFLEYLENKNDTLYKKFKLFNNEFEKFYQENKKKNEINDTHIKYTKKQYAHIFDILEESLNNVFNEKEENPYLDRFILD